METAASSVAIPSMLCLPKAQKCVSDHLSRGSLRNLQPWERSLGFHFRKGTITQSKTVESIAGKADAVIHLAAIVSPYVSVKRPEIANEVNVSGTLNVLRAALKKKVKSRVRLIVFSIRRLKHTAGI
jgi:nucleoside-diphosphate-sugar epimerase